jgi:hypothetical protein
MAEFTLDDVYHAAMQLPPDEQDALFSRLQAARANTGSITREQVLAEFERRKAAGAFDNVESLRNKYRNSSFEALTNDQLRDELRNLNT